jgi:hypothetical protein
MWEPSPSLVLALLVFAPSGSTRLQLGVEAAASDSPDGGDLRCEPSVAVRGDDVVVTWNDSAGGRTGSPAGVAVGWAVSRDAGRSFRFGGRLAACAGGIVSGADSRVVVDPDGNFFALVLSWTTDSQTLRTFRMDRDFGRWIELSPADRTNGSPYLDKPALAASAGGRLAVAYDRGGATAIVASHDGGRTWSAPLAVSATTPAIRTGAGIAVAGKRIVVSWMEGAGSKVAELWAASSSDDGRTFGAPVRVHRLAAPLPDPKGFSIGPGPFTLTSCDSTLAATSAAEDATFHLVCAEGAGRGARALLFASTDGGRTWSGPEPVGTVEGDTLVLFPSLAEAAGRPAVLAYVRPDASSSTLTRAELRFRRAAGDWETAVLSSVPTAWEAVPGDAKWAPIQRNFGDYVTLASDGRRLVAAWTDGRTGRPRIETRVVDVIDGSR